MREERRISPVAVAFEDVTVLPFYIKYEKRPKKIRHQKVSSSEFHAPPLNTHDKMCA